MKPSETQPGQSAPLVLFDRQRRLLRLLAALGGPVANLDFQNLLLLYCRECGAEAPYDFVPHRCGALSFTSIADRSKLAGRGLLTGDEHHWQLTDRGREAVAAPDLHLTAFLTRYAGLRGEALVAEVCRRFPWYAIRSESAMQVLAGDEDALAGIDRASPASGAPGICTIGYEGRTLESYLNELLRAGVTLLCDVRRNPISRKYGFSKGTLTKACDGVGIRYEHLPQLGIESEKRRSLDTQKDYDLLFAEYRRAALPRQTQSLDQIRHWVAGGERVALTCFERIPQQCHRHCVAEALQQRGGTSMIPKHL